MRRGLPWTWIGVALASAWGQPAFASSFEGSLQSLVTSFVARILPTVAIGYIGKNLHSHIRNDPEATRESIQIAFGVIALLGINGVWGWLQSNVR